MQSNNPADASSSSHACNLFSGGIPVDDDNRNEQAATGQAGAAQQPRLHAGNRSGTPPLSDDKRPDDHDRARELDALNDQLCSLRANVPLDLKQAVHFFGDVKASEQAIKTLLRDDPHNAALRKLADGLRAILPHLHVLLCRDDGPNPSLDLHTIHSLCMGLSTCVAPAMGAMFDKKRLQQLKPHLQAITNVLMERACKAGLQSATASIGIVLDILNWASRALKADCIDVSSSIQKVFDKALDAFEEALAGKTGPCGLTPHQIGKCAVQISAISKFSLIRLDNSEQGLAGCRRLTACGKRLCSAEIAARLGAGKIDAVVCTNVCNLIKDMMERHLLLATTGDPLWHGLMGLAGLILRIPADEMLATDCRILSNCANFLRVLDSHEAGVPKQAPIPNWEAASQALLAAINGERFMDCLPSGQAVANLISFVKHGDCHLRQSLPAGCNTTATTPDATVTTTTVTTATSTAGISPDLTQEMLRSAANRLIQHALYCSPDAFTTPETLSGLLSGLDYIVRRNLVAATPELKKFMAVLMDNMAWCSRKWQEKSRKVALPALRGLLAAKLVTLAQAQPGLAALLGPYSKASGYSMEDLAAAIREKGVDEAEIPALPPAEAALPVLPVPSRKPLRPILPPGYTRIIAPSTASSGHSDMSKQTAPSFHAAPPSRPTVLAAATQPQSQPWQSPRKVARANRQAGVSSVTSLPQAPQPMVSAAATPPERKAGPQPTPASATRSKQAVQAKPVQKKNQQTSRPTNASVKPEDEWFALLNSRNPTAPQRLRQLASQFKLLNLKKGKGQESRSALACALASGQLAVVKWLLAPETGYRFDEAIGPFLSAVEQDILLLDDEVVGSLDYFLAMQDDAARSAIQRHFATHQPANLGMQNVLKRHGLIGAGVSATMPTSRTSTTDISTTTTTTAITTTTTTTTAGNRKTFDQPDARAQVELGDCYWNGTAVKEDQAQAVEWYREAANQGLPEAQLKLGDCYWNGTGVSVDKIQAFEWYSAAAYQGLAEAQSSVGYCYQKGIGVEEHKVQAVGWYRTAARNGDATAQYRLGICYELGIGVNVDMAAAIKWYRKAADQGLAQAEFALGYCYENGTTVMEDKVHAFTWYSKAAYQGLAEAQTNLGMCYEHGTGVSRDYAKAAECYEKAANQGLAGAQINLGRCYWNGTGVPKDYTKAFSWYEKAASQGVAGAQFNLGICYWHGTGVPRDHAKALAWYEKAADQGFPEAQFSLGDCYWKGTEVKEDKAQAVAWYEKAANQGHAKAQVNLGMCYWNGTGVPRDYTNAFSWYEKAANQGLAEAQFNLGICYWHGTGVNKDPNQAIQWFRKAANQGHDQANAFLK